jgi:hypothetical protein
MHGDLLVLSGFSDGKFHSKIHIVSRPRTGRRASRSGERMVGGEVWEAGPTAPRLVPPVPSLPSTGIGEDLVRRDDGLESLLGLF